MFTDSTGVYEIVPNGSNWMVRWMLPNEAYRVMRGVYNLYNTSRTPPLRMSGRRLNRFQKLSRSYTNRCASSAYLQ